MKTFNAFQMVCLFAIIPFVLSWLSIQTFAGAGIAWWVGCSIYTVSFFLMTAAVRVGIEDL